MLIQPKLCQTLLVDIQVRLAAAMSEPEPMIRNCGVLMEAAKLAEVPLAISEQYPQGLGSTVAELAEKSTEDQRFAKVEFSCLRNEPIRKRLEATGRRQLILAGIEAHVCVLQTALDAKAGGYDVFVVADAITSRRPFSKEAAIERLAASGVSIVTTEMVVFEWAETAASKIFKPLSALVR